MEEQNIFIIILIIILLFFLSADKNITSETLDHNTIPLLLVLIIFYFCINNISLGILLISIIFLVLSTTDMKKIITERMSHYIDNASINGIEQFGLMFANKEELLKKAKEYADQKKKKDQEKKEIEEEKNRLEKEKNAEKSTNLLQKNDDYEKTSYYDFKKEVDQFNEVDNIPSKPIKKEIPIGLPEKKETKDLDTLMNKLDNDVHKL